MATIFRPPLITRIWSSDPAGVAVRAQAEFPQNIRPLLAALPAVLSLLFMPVPRADPAGVAARAQGEVTGSPIVLLTAVEAQPFQTSVTETPRGPTHPVYETTVFPNLRALTSAAPFPTQFTAYRLPAPDSGPAVRSLDSIVNRLPLNAALPLVGRVATDLPVRGLDRGPAIRSQPEATGTIRPLLAALPFTPVDYPNPTLPLSRFAAVTAQDGVTANKAPLVADLVPFTPVDWANPVRRVEYRLTLEPQNLLGLGTVVVVSPFVAVDLGMPVRLAPVQQPPVQGTLLPLLNARPFTPIETPPPVRPLSRNAAIGAQGDVTSNLAPLRAAVPFRQTPDPLPNREPSRWASLTAQDGVTANVRPLRASLPLIGRIAIDMPVRGLNRYPAIEAQAEVFFNWRPLYGAQVPFRPTDLAGPVIRRAALQTGDTQSRLSLTTRPFASAQLSQPVVARTVQQPDAAQRFLGRTAPVVARPFMVGDTALSLRLTSRPQPQTLGTWQPILIPTPGSANRTQVILI